MDHYTPDDTPAEIDTEMAEFDDAQDDAQVNAAERFSTEEPPFDDEEAELTEDYAEAETSAFDAEALVAAEQSAEFAAAEDEEIDTEHGASEAYGGAVVAGEVSEAAADGAESTVADEASAGFISRWSTLVSTTNWEKGRIIYEWRCALIDAGAGAQQYSDEAWTRRVGSVTGQHVGRLRRVWERFGQIRETFTGVYWSHFQAALDWEDAEMWLEGASQNRWSVSQMRSQRWEAYGAPAELKPRDEDVVASELDEDFQASDGQQFDGTTSTVQGDGGSEAPYSESDFGDESGDLDAPFEAAAASDEYDTESGSSGEATSATNRDLQRPLEDLPALPEDLADAFEQMKLAIVRHRMADWVEVSPQSVLASLQALQRLIKLEDA